MELNIVPVGFFSGGIWQIIGQTSLFGLIILIILVLMSLVSWSIMFNKWRLFRRVEEESWAFLNLYRKTGKISQMVGRAKSLRHTPLSGVFIEGYNEVADIISIKKANGVAEEQQLLLTQKDIDMVEMTLERARVEEISLLEKSVVFLATTANAAPFLGLLGTVVGVMDSFWAIGQRGSASLAVVAPGIAEALLATIVGLGAAIPAVIGFNWANNRLKGFNDKISNFSLEFLVRLKKDLT
ncbi:MAG TPA: Tol-Pal system subunit TolQ [candidate division Zixibacteria bacterium]|nr:Tol-Pal system subunit TolQ [candidate division Zixibacteria bacterium]